MSDIFLDRMPIRANIRAAPAAGLTREPGLDVGQPNVIGPPVGADRFPVAAPEVAAIDQKTANAGGAHLTERDLGRSVGHGAIEAQIAPPRPVSQ